MEDACDETDKLVSSRFSDREDKRSRSVDLLWRWGLSVPGVEIYQREKIVLWSSEFCNRDSAMV